MQEPQLRFIGDNALLTPEQAAQYLQVKLSTIYAWSMKKVIPTCKLGRLNRYRKSDLDAFIAANTQESWKS